MFPWRASLLVCLLLVLVLTSLYESASSECSVYLAPSTIPGAGLGMFAGKEFGLWETIGQPDIAIPVTDYYAHNPDTSNGFFFDSYGWNTNTFNHIHVEGGDSIVFSPGAGAALNCMLPLVNTVGADDEIEISNEGLHRSKDPGVGAFTPFYNRALISRFTIPAGHEFFDGYGDNYFKEREEAFGKIPLTDDYDHADDLLSAYVEMKDELCSEPRACGEESSNSTLNELHQDWYSMMTRLSSVWPSRVLNALPKDAAVVDEIAEVGTSYTYYNRSIRSLEWLEENGACMDNLEVRPSTIRQAGRGAFARRFIPKGSLVGPAPALHMKRSVLEMRPSYLDEDGVFQLNSTGPVVHYQIILNYCFGHHHSSMVMCPYGAVTGLINHSKEKANAKIVWNKKMMQHPEWLEQPLQEFIEIKTAGLLFDFIATRDIQPGDEVFIDYGDEWESAWNHHVATWKPPPDASSYMSARELNEQEEVIRTVAEGHYSEKHTRLLCRDTYRKWSGLPSGLPSHSYDDEEDKYLCKAVDRYERDGNTLYTAHLYNRIEDEDKKVCYEDLSEVMFDLPRDGFVFEDLQHSRDYAQHWSFRHDIRIPDDIMPTAWMDLLD